ncbi:MAG: 3-isopropylmalate dehydratase large subunit [Candidatus Eremiobacteraeota bacterium]|nr:3-isopropylmalate dehydratase large subunit [Candidatus Eremiobacteraeota bacterium]MBV8354723.1 3-isopropylmalate dehydratase large subunit [Candidatus Eremiobacteraeota bacterium]
MGRTLFEKVWDSRRVRELPGNNALLFADRIVAYELLGPPAIEQIEGQFSGRLYDPARIVAVNDHVSPAKDTPTAEMAQYLRTWAKKRGVLLFDVGDNGICHVVVPERGLLQPGMVVVCSDSHTCTLGAFAALATGIGSTALAGAMLAGAIILSKPKVMRVTVTGRLQSAAAAKDLALAVIARLGFKGGTGYVLEYAGDGLAALSMEERMTLCNMAIEAGATTGMCPVDETTISYLRGREFLPRGAEFDALAEEWRRLVPDDDARYDAELQIDAAQLVPTVTWGIDPGQSAPVTGNVPEDADAAALRYMDLKPGTPLRSIALDQAFIGSCTNARITDLRAAAAILAGRRVTIPTIVTPGSQAIKRQAESEGLHDVFQDAGALWTHASCGACPGLSTGVLAPGMRCISSSNRNFPGRMGEGGRVHLASPAIVAASAVLGRIAAPDELPVLVNA